METINGWEFIQNKKRFISSERFVSKLKEHINGRYKGGQKVQIILKASVLEKIINMKISG